MNIFVPKEPIRKRAYLTLAVSGFVFFLAIWSALTYGGYIDALFLPTPTAILVAFKKLFMELGFLEDIQATVIRVMVGFAVAAAIGVPLGILVGTYKAVEAFVEPLMAFIRYMPASAFIPLFILWIGVNETEKMAVIFFGSFFQLVLMVAVVANGVSKELIDVSYTLGTSKWGVVRRVLLPASMPGIMDALRMILGWAWTYVVVAEIIGADSGIGYTILQSQRMLRTANIIAGILTIGMLGLITDYMFKWLQRRLFPWT